MEPINFDKGWGITALQQQSNFGNDKIPKDLKLNAGNNRSSHFIHKYLPALIHMHSAGCVAAVPGVTNERILDQLIDHIQFSPDAGFLVYRSLPARNFLFSHPGPGSRIPSPVFHAFPGYSAPVQHDQKDRVPPPQIPE